MVKLHGIDGAGLGIGDIPVVVTGGGAGVDGGLPDLSDVGPVSIGGGQTGLDDKPSPVPMPYGGAYDG